MRIRYTSSRVALALIATSAIVTYLDIRNNQPQNKSMNTQWETTP